MADKQHRSPLFSNIPHFAQALSLKLCISNSEDLIDDKNIRIQMCSYGEG